MLDSVETGVPVTACDLTSCGRRTATVAARAAAALLVLGTIGALGVLGVHAGGARTGASGPQYRRRDRYTAKHTPAPAAQSALSEHALALNDTATADMAACDGLPPPVPGDVKLTHYPSGFVLTFSDDGIWRPMCANFVTVQSTRVVCRMLGYGGSTTHHNARLSKDNVSHGLSPGVQCEGSETNVHGCRRDPDFDAGWSDCQKYPSAMALYVKCNGNIGPAASNDYQMDRRFTPSLKHVARVCGSSGILRSIMSDIEGVNDADYSHAPLESSSSSGGTNVGAIVGPLFAGLGLTAITAGAHAAAQHKQEALQREQMQLQQQQLQQQQQQQWQPPPEFDKTDYRTRAAGASRGFSLVDELRGLAELHEEGLLTDGEYSAAKAKVLGSY